MTADDIAARLDAMRERYGDAALADAWRAVCDDARAVLGVVPIIADEMRRVHALMFADGIRRPPFDRQPWAPRRRVKKECRR